jgi:hypothetical protein
MFAGGAVGGFFFADFGKKYEANRPNARSGKAKKLKTAFSNLVANRSRIFPHSPNTRSIFTVTAVSNASPRKSGAATKNAKTSMHIEMRSRRTLVIGNCQAGCY